ncbi:MAG: EscT/YscT/HrcT family type III secretion system export apparatus protein [Parachlamydiaceae bacterium]
MTADYVSLYMNTAFAQNDFLPFLSLMFLFFGRILPIIALVPFFGGKLMPRPAKVTFAISLFAIFLPQLLIETTTPLTFNLQLVIYLAKEMLVGLLLGFFLGIPFIIVQSTGILIDHQRGGSSLMVNDPTIQNQSSPLGTMYNYVLIYLFFAVDGPFTVLDILSQSFTILPVDKMLNSAVFSDKSEIVQYTTSLLGKVMILATQLAAPALIMILMTDFFLGIANRLAPQVQITFLGMPLKSLLGLTIVFFGWSLFTHEILAQTNQSLDFILYLVKQLKPSVY